MNSSVRIETDFIATGKQLPECDTPLKCAPADPFYLNHFNVGDKGKIDKCECLDEDDYPMLVAHCSVGNSSKNEEACISSQYDHNPNEDYQCIFDRAKIDLLSQAQRADAKYGPNNPVSNAFCQSQTTTCPVSMNSCSRYFSEKEDGTFCRNAIKNLSPYQKDAVIQNYCLRHNTDDCKCVNRSSNPDYQKLKQGNPFTDSCWYLPCSDKSQYFIPSEFASNPTCSSDVCQIVYDISKAHNVDIDHVKNDINCNFSGHIDPLPQNFFWYFVVLVIGYIALCVYASKKRVSKK